MASRHFDELELDSIPFDPNSADEYAAPISDLQQQVMEKVTQGFRAQEEGTYDVAIVRYDQALEHDNIPFQVICFIHSNLSRCHQITGDRIRAIEHAEAHVQVLKIAASQNQLGGAGDRLMAAAYNDLGLACYSQGNYERALLEFELAVAYSSRRGSDPKLLIRSQGNLGNALACQGKFKQAFAHHSEQLRLAEATLAPNDPERAEMLKKAAFNLQSDCNSLAKYEKASQYERHVKSATSGRPMSQDMDELPLAASATPSLVNDTVGDGSLSRKQLHHGWVCKHKGGKFLEPTRLTHKKRWAALTNGIFMYNNTAAVSKPARCIRVEHITDVYTTQLHEDEKALGLARSFKLFTGTRTYYFTCSSEREASAWVQAIARARTDRAQFARMTTVQRTRGAASLAFGGTSSAHARANQQQDAYMDGEDMAMTMSTFDAVPYGFADKENVENPLYNSMLDDTVQLGEPPKSTLIDQTAFEEQPFLQGQEPDDIEIITEPAVRMLLRTLSTFHDESTDVDAQTADEVPRPVARIAGLDESAEADSRTDDGSGFADIGAPPARLSMHLERFDNALESTDEVGISLDDEEGLSFMDENDEMLNMTAQAEVDDLERLAADTADLFQQLHGYSREEEA